MILKNSWKRIHIPNKKLNFSLGPLKFGMKIRDYIKQYGKTGIAVYLGLTSASYISIYFLIKNGVDFQPLLKKLNIANEHAEGAGTLIAAYAVNKALTPLKLLLTASLTPRIHRVYQTYKFK